LINEIIAFSNFSAFFQKNYCGIITDIRAIAEFIQIKDRIKQKENLHNRQYLGIFAG
jgi:glutaredoxin-related protein